MSGNIKVKFGPSGNSKAFYQQGHKSSINMPKWLSDMGLDAYEYSCTHGVNLKEETARSIGKQAKAYGITMSVHAPYYINLSASEKDKQRKSKQYLLDSLKAAWWFGAERVVFHPGSCRNKERKECLKAAGKVILEVLEEGKFFVEKGIFICPETMGKKNQLGTLEEILYLCALNDMILPTLDFGHMHALEEGGIKSKEDYQKIFDIVENTIGSERTSIVHCHFSRIEYSKGGEKRHWTLADTGYGPEFPPLAEVLVERSLHPIIICESRGTMAEDAVLLKNIYKGKLNLFNR